MNARGIFAAALLVLFVAVAGRAGENLASRVVVLANRDDPDSLRIAQHYADARGVPRENIVALPLPTAESVSWPEFVTTLWTPLQDELLKRHWLDAIPMALTDAVGRRKVAVHEHRIAALVVCRGVPLKIAHDPALYAELRPFTAHGEYRTNAGCVDAELSLLAQPNYPINAFVPNPLFQNEHPTAFERAQVILVSRLDAPTADDALALVDRALAAERDGLLGRGYVDLSGRDPEGDRWLESVAKQLDDLGFDTDVDHAPATMPESARCDAPALYFGWYAGNAEGPFVLPGFQFPSGAIALHIHSYSAGTLRSTTSGWCGPLLAHGVTATMGNVHEPYLRLTHRPDLLLRALTRGETLVEAAYFSLPVLSWQAVLIGDPLYRPFAVPLDEQLKNTSPLAGYAALRKAHLLDAAKRRDEADALLRETQHRAPSLAVGVALAQRRRAAADRAGVAQALAAAAQLKTFRPDEWELAREAAQLLAANGQLVRAVEVWRTLLSAPAPTQLRIPWLRDAIDAAHAAKDATQAAVWEKELGDEKK